MITKLILQQELDKVESEMIQHFEDTGIEELYDAIYLTEKDYFPKIDDLDLVNDLEFSKWFYYFQGQYQKVLDLIELC